MSINFDQRPHSPHGAPAVHQVLRRTTISFGPLNIVREEHRYGAEAAGTRSAQRRGFGNWYPIGLAALLCVGAGGIAIAATGGPAKGDYVVSLPVPDSVPIMTSHRTTKAPSRHVHRAVRAPEAAETATADSDGTENAPDQTVSKISRAAAIEAALRSGEMQEWSAGTSGEAGFVVAGPSDRVGTRACRDLSILTRSPGSPDRVDQRRECRTHIPS
ncbi:MAG: hypothetical protein P0Y64_03755 [Candidatus Sphingomonas colombiensis]|nr:hypothetical protein [Sphingomonas sp.]WEK43955.1 MAG: hypothetical protein P0Y64_03755 [Sphingomonas sp.]